MSQVAIGPFSARLAQVRGLVDTWLAGWLGKTLVEAAGRGEQVRTIAAALADLVMRGGKRLRAGLLVAAYEACRGTDVEAVLPAAAALELLQAYFLVHDDWMDGDDERRGAPSVPAVMRVRFPGNEAATSVLAGDLAAAWAQQVLLLTDLPGARLVEAAREMASAHEQVVAGQVLDVCAVASDEAQAERVYALKTASYTVRAPVVMGAKLAGAGDAQTGALAAWAEPLGVAFQLRDDVLGVFGDARVTGKPTGGDLRRGKRTALVVHAMRDARAAQAVGRVLGRDDASDADVAAAVEAIEASGARARVETRIGALVDESRTALARAELTAAGRAILEDAAAVLARRER